MVVLMQVTINNIPWKIKVVKRTNKKLNPDNGAVYLGLCDYEKSTIRIRKGMNYMVTRQTVIHELVHAFLFSYGIEVSGDEPMCNFFGSHADAIVELTNQIMEGVNDSC